MRRARRAADTSPEARLQRRLSNVEGRPPGWRSFRSDDNGPLRIVRGIVATAGPTITAGGGYTVAKNGVGDVTITFNTPFASQPAATAISDGVGHVVSCTATLAGSVRLVKNVPGVGNADGSIHFQVVGPA